MRITHLDAVGGGKYIHATKGIAAMGASCRDCWTCSCLVELQQELCQQATGGKVLTATAPTLRG